MNYDDKTEGFPQYFTVVSSSMEPLLKIGDKITATPVKIEDLKEGQVVVYLKNSQYIVHRIVSLRGFVAVTAGDNVRRFDFEPVSVFDIIGVVKDIPVEKAKSKIYRFFRAVKRKFFRKIGLKLSSKK